MKVELRKNFKTYSLFVDGLLQVESSYPIEPVAPGSDIYKVPYNKMNFYLYCTTSGNFVRHKKLFYAVKHYSPDFRTFVACYHSPDQANLCSLIYPDGSHESHSALSIGESLNGFRIVQLTESSWVYYDEKEMRLLYHSGKPWRRNLAPRFLRFGSFYHIDSSKHFLWYYDEFDKYKGGKHIFTMFQFTLSDEFVEIPETSFFVGVNVSNPNTDREHRKYSIYHIDNLHHISKGSVDYDCCEYLSEIHAFLVKTQLGWALVQYDMNEHDFVLLLPHYYFVKPDIHLHLPYIFIHNDSGHWDFIAIGNISQSFVWKYVDLFDNDSQPYIEAVTFDDEKKKIFLSEIYGVFVETQASIQRILKETRIEEYAPQSRFITSHILDSSQSFSEENITDLSIAINEDFLNQPETSDLDVSVNNEEKKNKFESSDDFDSPSLLPLEISDELHIEHNNNSFCLRAVMQRSLVNIVQETYSFLIQNSAQKDVFEAIFFLFKDRITELYHVSENVDKMLLSVCPADFRNVILNTDFVNTHIRSCIPDSELAKFDLCMKYKTEIEDIPVAQALDEAIEIMNFSDDLRKKIQSVIERGMIDKQQDLLQQSEPTIKHIFQNIALGKFDAMKTDLSNLMPESKETSVSSVLGTCHLTINKKDFNYSLDQEIPLSDLKIGYQTHISKSDCILIVLPIESLHNIKNEQGMYEIIGRGQDKKYNQDFSDNVNEEIRAGRKRIFLFFKEDDDYCRFYDEVQYVSHKRGKEKTNWGDRFVILFSFQSLLRYK